MKIKEYLLQDFICDKDYIRVLSTKLHLTTEEIKSLLIRYAFNKLVVLDDVSSIDEIADALRRKYLKK